jgi:hypothetical protein
MAKAFDFPELVRGASINQLGQLFDLDRRTVTDRLKEVKPSGRRATFPIYRVADVAELLVTGYMTQGQLTEAQKMQKADKAKDYWDAKLKEQKYLENMGDLWRTEKIVEVLAEVFKQFRESVVVFSDAMEHEAGLPPQQIEKAKAFCDGLLVEMREKLVHMDIDDQGDHVPPEPANDDPEEDLRAMGLI